jgi:photosystem II stability/assembly factor-like uncharacterized protein
MNNLRAALGAVAACLGMASLAASAVDPWRDVLDTPAAASPLAVRGLISGLARAGERIVAVGQRGHVLWSDDAGGHWQQASAVPVTSDLVAVAFPTPTRGYAVGHDGVILASSDAGKTWQRLLDGRTLGELLLAHYEHALDAATDAAARERAQKWLGEARRFAEQPAQNPWLDVWFADALHGYVVGAFGLALQTSDGGAHWTPLLDAVDNPKQLHLYAVRGIGADVFMVGEQGLVLKSDGAANRFRALELPYAGTLFGIAGNRDALVVHGLRGTILRSTDGGQRWQQLPPTVSVGLTASASGADGRLYIASQAGHVLASSDGGASFAPLALERTIPAAAVLAAGTTLFVAGPRGVQPLALR